MDSLNPYKVGKSYKSLFLDILKIGQNRIQEGLSYEHLKMELSKKGYDLTCDCIELAIKQWFFDCFHHRNEDGDVLKDIKDLEMHLECNFVMKGESCLKLLERKTARTNIWIAFAAILISILSLAFTIYKSQQ